MADHERSEAKLTPKQLQAVAALLTSPGIQQAATAAGVPESTLRRWRGLPAFRDAMRVATEELWQSIARQLQSNASLAVDTLVEVCRTGDKDSARVAAARWLLELSLKTREQLDLSARLEAVEAAVREEAL